ASKHSWHKPSYSHIHSLDFSTAFLQGSLHEEIWLRRPPGFTGSFPPGTHWSLRRPVYGLRQAPREWYDTLRTTLAALGFAPSTADPSLFLRTDTSLPPFYILVSFSASASRTPRHSSLPAGPLNNPQVLTLNSTTPLISPPLSAAPLYLTPLPPFFPLAPAPPTIVPALIFTQRPAPSPPPPIPATSPPQQQPR
ncbi:unnamed protein product, partial [Closterium sp. NIES-54]